MPIAYCAQFEFSNFQNLTDTLSLNSATYLPCKSLWVNGSTLSIPLYEKCSFRYLIVENPIYIYYRNKNHRNSKPFCLRMLSIVFNDNNIL